MPLTYMHWQWDRVGKRDRPKWPLTILCSPSQFWFGHTHKYHLDWLLFVNILAFFFRPLILCVFFPISNIRWTEWVSVAFVFGSSSLLFVNFWQAIKYNRIDRCSISKALHYKWPSINQLIRCDEIFWVAILTHTHYFNKNEMYSEHIAWNSTR